jgi:hypothetical protein
MPHSAFSTSITNPGVGAPQPLRARSSCAASSSTSCPNDCTRFAILGSGTRATAALPATPVRSPTCKVPNGSRHSPRRHRRCRASDQSTVPAERLCPSCRVGHLVLVRKLLPNPAPRTVFACHAAHHSSFTPFCSLRPVQAPVRQISGDQGTDLRWATEIPSTRPSTPALPGIGSRGGRSSFCRQP